MEKNNDFIYSYSAEQRQEIEAIRKKYLPQEQNKMEQLRRLHASASSRAKALAITVGVIGTLLLGSGMSLVMTRLGTLLSLSPELSVVLGLVMGLAGLVLVALAYPVYDRVVKKDRERIAPEILRLTDELLK